MPIFLVLLLTGSAAAVEWPEPAHGPAAAAFAAFAVLAPVAAGAVLAHWAAGAVRRSPGRRGEIAATYGKIRRRLAMALLGLFAAAVGLGWGWTVWHRAALPDGRLFPFAELLVPLPYLLAVLAAWGVHYRAERELHCASSAGQNPFFTRGEHFLHHARPLVLLVVLPLVLFAGQQSFGRFYPEAANSLWAQFGVLIVLALMFVLLPLAVKPVLGLKTLPAGETRDRLEAAAVAAGFRCRDLLLWPTRGSTANALVVGIVPQARYVVFTDGLLDALAPDELDAVFGHEIGHVKHGHIPYYLGFFGLSVTVCTAAAVASANALADAGVIDRQTAAGWAALPPLAVTGAYLFVVFGFLSRKCERQADLYGCRVAGGGTITPAGINAMIRALERVAFLNGMDTEWVPPNSVRGVRAVLRSWLHGPIPERIRFLVKVLENPQEEPAYQRRVRWVRWGLIFGLFSAAAGLTWAVGWDELVKAL